MPERLTKPPQLEPYLFLLCTASYVRYEALQNGADFPIDSADPVRLSKRPEGIDHPMKTALQKSRDSVTNHPEKRKKVGLGIDVGAKVNGVELHNLKRMELTQAELNILKEETYDMYCAASSRIVWTIGLCLLSDELEIANLAGIEIVANFNPIDPHYVDNAFENSRLQTINTRVPMIELAPQYARSITAKNETEDVRRRGISPELAHQLIVGGLPTQDMLNALAQQMDSGDRNEDGVSIVHLPIPRRS